MWARVSDAHLWSTHESKKTKKRKKQSNCFGNIEKHLQFNSSNKSFSFFDQLATKEPGATPSKCLCIIIQLLSVETRIYM